MINMIKTERYIHMAFLFIMSNTYQYDTHIN